MAAALPPPISMEFPKLVMSAGEVSGTAVRCWGSAPCVRRKSLQCHRITEWSGLAGPSVGHPAQPPAAAGSPRAGCTAPRPGGKASCRHREFGAVVSVVWHLPERRNRDKVLHTLRFQCSAALNTTCWRWSGRDLAANPCSFI